MDIELFTFFCLKVRIYFIQALITTLLIIYLT